MKRNDDLRATVLAQRQRLDSVLMGRLLRKGPTNTAPIPSATSAERRREIERNRNALAAWKAMRMDASLIGALFNGRLIGYAGGTSAQLRRMAAMSLQGGAK